jgi:hypothetical protein
MEFDTKSGAVSGFRKPQYDALENKLLPNVLR